jgi:hypothetical protein
MAERAGKPISSSSLRQRAPLFAALPGFVSILRV